VIVKRFSEAYRAHFSRERAGLSSLAGIAALDGFVPKLLADDEAEATLLIECVEQKAPYAAVVGSRGDESVRVLVESARRLGLLHGHARSAISDFRARSPEPASPGALLRAALSSTMAFIEQTLAGDPAGAVGFAPGAIHSALLAVAARVDEQDSLSTITLGDMAPSNVLLGTSGPVFIDLEYSGIRSGFYDAMYWHCIYPVGPEIADLMDTAYRDGLGAAGVSLSEPRYLAGTFLFMSHRLFWTLSWNLLPLLEQDRDVVPGVSARQTIRRYLREYVRFASKLPFVEYPALLDVAERLDARLCEAYGFRL
jgi:hypothetical protein